MQKNNNNNSALKNNENKLSFVEWAKENKQLINSSLITDGINFINENAEQLSTPISNLIINNRWHYIDKPKKKQSYRGEITCNSDGIPYLNLTYYTFRHGGQSVRFNSKEAIKELWLQERREFPLKCPTRSRIISSKPHETKPVSQIDWLKHDFEQWKSFKPSTEDLKNAYLKRKGLLGERIPGLRVGIDELPFELLKKGIKPVKKPVLAVKLINRQGNYCGLQKIDSLGEKRFTKGLSKKGSFALIGEDCLPEHLETVHICEGVATACSIFLATGEPVFVAMDAFNLLPASRNLKFLYSKASIQIWADNDWQKASKKLKGGKLLGNTGLIHANRTAFKLRNALVCTPDFNHLDESAKVSATDFNDLHLLCGLQALVDIPACKPDIPLALWHESFKYNRCAHGVVTPSQFAQGKKITYNNRYLPQSLFDDAGNGIHLVRSAIGTGKTEVVEKLIKKNPDKSVLFTTHLISLVESAASRLTLVSYNECDNFDLQIESRIAICLNSLGKLTAEGRLRDYDIVVIDEIEQVLARLTTKIEQKPLIFAVLKYVMQNAKMLICLDAHLSNTTAELISRFCPGKSVTIHFNTYEQGVNKEILFYDSVESLQLDALNALSNDKTVYLAFNAKREAYKTYSAINTAFPDKKGLYISSDSTGEKDSKAFFNNVNNVSKQYDYMVCTPSVSTGVSIDNGHFDFVGGIFNSQINTANDCIQALGRIRNHNTLHVFCEKRLGSKPLSPDVIRSKWSQTHAYDLSLMNLSEVGHKILLNPDYEQLTLLVTQAKNRSFNDFYEQFCLLALHDGMSLGYSDKSINAELKQYVTSFKAACIEQGSVKQEALELSAIELKNLANKPRKTLAETATYKKQQIIAFYQLSAHDEENITALTQVDNEGRFRKSLLNLEMALGDEQLAKKRFLEQLETGAQFAADLTHFAVLQQLLKKLLQTLNLDTSRGILSTEDYQYDAESLLKSGFFEWIEQNRNVLQGLISLPTANQLKKNPLRFISNLLSRVGLKQKRVGRAEKGLYHLDSERIELMNALTIRRRSTSMSAGIPLDAASKLPKKQSCMHSLREGLAKIKAFLAPKSLNLAIPI